MAAAVASESTGDSNSDSSPHKNGTRTLYRASEGVYNLISVIDFAKNLRISANSSQQQHQTSNVPIRLSRLCHQGLTGAEKASCDLLCVNYGYDLFVLEADAISKSEDHKPADRKVYEKNYPTCHDFRPTPHKPKSSLFQSNSKHQQSKLHQNFEILIGLNNGQIQLADNHNIKKIFNADLQVDKSKVTCLKWVPTNSNHFVAGYCSGFLYTFDVDKSSTTLPLTSTSLSSNCNTTSNFSGTVFGLQSAPISYQLLKSSRGLSVYTVKSGVKSSLSVTPQQHINPMNKWQFDANSIINDIAFSPCSNFLATASQDGYARVLDYASMEIKMAIKSYFGGLRCLAWSSDCRYLAVGGEDDLISVLSLQKEAVVCRCSGHKSRISAIAFDPFVVDKGYANKSVHSSVHSQNQSGESPVQNGCNNGNLSTNVIFESGNMGSKTASVSFSKKSSLTVSCQLAPAASSKQTRDNGNIASTSNGLDPFGNEDTKKCDHNEGLSVEKNNSDKAAFETYRLISVAEDTLVCLWDLNKDVLSSVVKPVAVSDCHPSKLAAAVNLQEPSNSTPTADSRAEPSANGVVSKSFFPFKLGKTAPKKSKVSAGVDSAPISFSISNDVDIPSSPVTVKSSSKLLPQKFASLSIFDQRKRDKELKSSGSTAPSSQKFATVIGSEFGSGNKILPFPSNTYKTSPNSCTAGITPSVPHQPILIPLGSPQCPRLSEVPTVEPIICKKASHDRLTALSISADNILMTSQEGCMYVWARPAVAVKL